MSNCQLLFCQLIELLKIFVYTEQKTVIRLAIPLECVSSKILHKPYFNYFFPSQEY